MSDAMIDLLYRFTDQCAKAGDFDVIRRLCKCAIELDSLDPELALTLLTSTLAMREVCFPEREQLLRIAAQRFTPPDYPAELLKGL